ncbi:MAG: hypothetical protein ABWY18_03925 [Tardiphaga sp.]
MAGSASAVAASSAAVRSAEIEVMGHQMNEKIRPHFNNPQWLTMINHDAGRIGLERPSWGRPEGRLTGQPGLPHGAAMNGFLSICGACREMMS